MPSTNEQPIACDLTRLDETGRRREGELLRRFRGIFSDATWTGAGYRFAVPSDPATLAELGELLALERLCCPFLRWELSVTAEERAHLHVSGPGDAREFLEKTFIAA